MTMLRCPLDGFHLQRGRGQTFCNPERKERLPVQPPVLPGASRNQKPGLLFFLISCWSYIFFSRRQRSTFTKRGPQLAAAPPQASAGKSKSCCSAPLGCHSHSFVIRRPCLISRPSETRRPLVPVISLRHRHFSPPSCKHLALLGFIGQMCQKAASSLASAEDLRLAAVTQSSQDLIRGTSGFSLDWEQLAEARTKLWSETVFLRDKGVCWLLFAANWPVSNLKESKVQQGI